MVSPVHNSTVVPDLSTPRPQPKPPGSPQSTLPKDQVKISTPPRESTVNRGGDNR